MFVEINLFARFALCPIVKALCHPRTLVAVCLRTTDAMSRFLLRIPLGLLSRFDRVTYCVHPAFDLVERFFEIECPLKQREMLLVLFISEGKPRFKFTGVVLAYAEEYRPVILDVRK